MLRTGTVAAIIRQATLHEIRTEHPGPTGTLLGIVHRAIVRQAAVTVRNPRIGATRLPHPGAIRLHRHAAIPGDPTRLRRLMVPREDTAVDTPVPPAAGVDRR